MFSAYSIPRLLSSEDLHVPCAKRIEAKSSVAVIIIPQVSRRGIAFDVYSSSVSATWNGAPRVRVVVSIEARPPTLPRAVPRLKAAPNRASSFSNQTWFEGIQLAVNI